MKQYIGISRDHSGSMSLLRTGAMKDYNQTVDAIRTAANKQNIDTIISTVRCGINSGVDREVVNSSINALKPITSYEVSGQTPLFDSVLELITMFETAPDRDDPNVSFLVMAITDGEENASKKINGPKLGDLVRKLQATDKWTFVFRVPRGSKYTLERLGIPAGNILEWEQSERGIAEATVATAAAFDTYYSGRASGLRSTKAFYTDLSNVMPADLQNNLSEITNEVKLWENFGGEQRIDDFVAAHGVAYNKGHAFYQLTKREKNVQNYKKIVLRDRNTGKIFGGGDTARKMLGLPTYGDVSVVPGDHKNFEIFIQSTSLNRNIPSKAKVLYWERLR